jgi:hypothetical protein
MEKHFLGSLPLIEKLVKCDKRELGNGTYRQKHIMLQSAEGMNEQTDKKNLKLFFLPFATIQSILKWRSGRSCEKE